MSAKSFLKFIEVDPQLLAFGACVRQLDLLRPESRQQLPAGAAQPFGNAGIGGGKFSSHTQAPRLALVLDGEDCLDRLYGGYFSDWSCGGQWRHMIEFLATLIGTLHQTNVHLAIYFNGALEPSRFSEWTSAQSKLKSNAKNVFKHLRKRATPPPKAWWLPPTGLQTLLRMALRTLSCAAFSSLDEHKLEVMSFCWENGYHGVMGEDADYALFSPPRYFSSHSLKLSLQLEVIATEYAIDDVAKALDLNPNRFCLLGALLGNHILPPKELRDFHEKLAPEIKETKYKVGFERVIRAVVNYIRTLPTIDDFETLGHDVFGDPKDLRLKRLRESMRYYQLGSLEGYSKQKPKTKKKKSGSIKLASEDAEGDPEKKKSSNENDLVERIALDLDKMDLEEAVAAANKVMSSAAPTATGITSNGASPHYEDESDDGDDDTSDGESGGADDKENMSVIKALASGVKVAPSEAGKYPVKIDSLVVKPICIPDVQSEVLRMASDRHRQGAMSPYIYQLLTRGEIKLPVLLEDESDSEVPAVHQVYSQLRQAVYAVLFNLHHLKYNRRKGEEAVSTLRKKSEEQKKVVDSRFADASESERESALAKAEDSLRKEAEAKLPPKPVVVVREWLPYNDYARPSSVSAAPLGWAVPTVQRLWFGPGLEDKQKRLRAFLSCMQCDEVKPLLSHANVPQHLLILACVLRYVMMQESMPVLRKAELDAFLATAFSPELADPHYLAEMRLDMVTPRGVQLATLFMQGIEMALLANDACGAPVPFHMSLPWTYFDGKLFHSKLRRATTARNLMDLCEGRLDVVMAVERMRSAILHGIVPQYAAPPFGAPQYPMAMAPPLGAGYGRLPGRMDARGGQLIVGGAVVGEWGANFGRGRGQPGLIPLKKNKFKQATKKASDSAESDDKTSSDAAETNGHPMKAVESSSAAAAAVSSGGDGGGGRVGRSQDRVSVGDPGPGSQAGCLSDRWDRATSSH